MPLALYRRHRRDCKSGHAEGMRTSEYDERKKGWKRCECPIFTSGTLQGHFKRQNTGQWEWAAAQPIVLVANSEIHENMELARPQSLLPFCL